MQTLYLIVTIAGERVAMAAATVQSVVEIDAITPVPRVMPHIAGLAAMRSRVLTIIDCCRSLGLSVDRPTSARRAVIVNVETHHYGLLVDDVADIVPIAAAPRPATLALAPGWARAAAGLVEHEGEVLLLLDPAALVEGPPALAA